MKAKIYKIHGRNLYVPDYRTNYVHGSGKVINGILEYTITEKVHIKIKTKAFTALKIELPKVKDDIHKIMEVYDKYGEYVAALLIKLAQPDWRLVQVRRINWLRTRIKDFKKYPGELLNLVHIQYDLGLFGFCLFDVFYFDKSLSKIYPEYDAVKLKYKYKNGASLYYAVKEIFGIKGTDLITELIYEEEK